MSNVIESSQQPLIEGDLASGHVLNCPKPDSCSTCLFDRRWRKVFPLRPYPSYVIQMLAQARIRAVLQGSHEIMEVCKIFERQDQGVVISHYTDPIQVTHMKDYKYAPRQALQLYAQADPLMARLMEALDKDIYNIETHFLFAIIIETPNQPEATYFNVFPVSKYAYRHVNVAMHQQQKEQKDPQTLTDMLNSIQWCCQVHLLRQSSTKCDTMQEEQGCAGITTQPNACDHADDNSMHDDVNNALPPAPGGPQ